MPIARSTFLYLATLLSLFAVVLPNAHPPLTAASLVATGLIALGHARWSRDLEPILAAYLISAAVTLFYIFVGLRAGAPVEAAYQTLIIYLIAPLLWLITCSTLVTALPDQALARLARNLALLCCISIGLFFTLFLTFGPSAVTFFQTTPNVDIRDGRIGATMHVYGSLIFLTAGFFAAPSLVGGKWTRLALLALLLLAAFTSGRSALKLAVIIGMTIGLCLSLWRPRASPPTERPAVMHRLLMALALAASLLLIGPQIGLDVGTVLADLAEKLLAGGGGERTEQFHALLLGIDASGGLGAGHGIGVDYLRSTEYPWRYELVWVASVLRVGVAGALLYSLPFVAYLVLFLHRWRCGRTQAFDIFLFSGFCSAFIASSTNPYLEGFTFQWMYTLPLVHLCLRHPLRIAPSLTGSP